MKTVKRKTHPEDLMNKVQERISDLESVDSVTSSIDDYGDGDLLMDICAAAEDEIVGRYGELIEHVSCEVIEPGGISTTINIEEDYGGEILECYVNLYDLTIDEDEIDADADVIADDAAAEGLEELYDQYLMDRGFYE